MGKRTGAAVCVALGIVAGVTTSCGSDGGGGTAAGPDGCTPGESRACVGPAGCSGGQICGEDGATFGPCDCGGASAGGGGPGASGAGGQSGSNGGTGPATGGVSPGGASGGAVSGGAGGTSAGGFGGSGGSGFGGASSGGGMGGVAGGAGGSGGVAGGAGGMGGTGAGSCAGGNRTGTCGNGVLDPGEICYLPPQVVSYTDDLSTAVNDSAMADVTGDGRPDLVALTSYTAGSTTARLHVVSLPSGGSLSASPPTSFSPGTLVYGPTLAVGERSGDAFADALVWGYYEFAEFPGDATGTFGAPSSGTPPATPPQPFVLGDVDKNGTLDLIASGGVVTVYPADAGGVFGTATSTSPGGMAAFKTVLADLTNDGYPELLGGSGGAVSIGLNDGAGVFSFWSQYSIPGGTSRPQAADIDEDGFVDIVVGTSQAQVHVLRGNGFAGVIGDSEPHAVASSTVGVVYPIDITNDGCLDLVAFHTGGVISVLPATSPGTFDTYRTYPGLRGDVYAGDINGDGAIDFASAGVDTAAFVLSNP